MSRRTRRVRCVPCGSIFFTEHPTKIYCDDECRRAARRLKK